MGFDRQRLPDPATYFASQGLKLIGRTGKWRTTSCVFHGGSDSMRVNLTTGGWCCMNCGAKGGDVLAYHMEHHRLDFVEAARQLGAWLHDGQVAPPRRDASPLPPPSRAAGSRSRGDAGRDRSRERRQRSDPDGR